jgi:hypothetical protein
LHLKAPVRQVALQEVPRDRMVLCDQNALGFEIHQGRGKKVRDIYP